MFKMKIFCTGIKNKWNDLLACDYLFFFFSKCLSFSRITELDVSSHLQINVRHHVDNQSVLDFLKIILGELWQHLQHLIITSESQCVFHHWSPVITQRRSRKGEDSGSESSGYVLSVQPYYFSGMWSSELKATSSSFFLKELPILNCVFTWWHSVKPMHENNVVKWLGFVNFRTKYGRIPKGYFRAFSAVLRSLRKMIAVEKSLFKPVEQLNQIFKHIS